MARMVKLVEATNLFLDSGDPGPWSCSPPTRGAPWYGWSQGATIPADWWTGHVIREVPIGASHEAQTLAGYR